ncbi:hypothetical protein GCM10010510_41410 [Streptomyces anandii JCM 4720]|nr:hypothetical protein GCM10010510_41410 [Streptomyces anandii JCM 4720]
MRSAAASTAVAVTASDLQVVMRMLIGMCGTLQGSTPVQKEATDGPKALVRGRKGAPPGAGS